MKKKAGKHHRESLTDKRQDAQIERLAKEEVKDDKDDKTIAKLAKEVAKLKHHEKEEHKKKRAVKGSVVLKFGNGKQVKMAQQGQTGKATASEFDQNGAPFTVVNPDALVWSASDSNISAVAVGDGTPTANVTVGASTAPGDYMITFSDPAAPALVVTGATLTVEAATAVATTGSVALGPFA